MLPGKYSKSRAIIFFSQHSRFSCFKSRLNAGALSAAILLCTSCIPSNSRSSGPPNSPIPNPSPQYPQPEPLPETEPLPEPLPQPEPPPEPEPLPEPLPQPEPPPEPEPLPETEPLPEPLPQPEPPPEPQPPEELPEPTPLPPQASDFETNEYFGLGTGDPQRILRYYGLSTLKASSAYAAGATGAGVRVAVVDTGIYADLDELSGRDIPVADLRSQPATPIEANSHGTLVAAILGANRDGAGFHGIAPEVSLIDVRANLESFDLVGTLQTVSGLQADILSFSAGAPVVMVPADSLTEQELERQHALFTSHLNAIAGHGVILVLSAGNDATPADSDQGIPAIGQWPGYPAILAGQMLCDRSLIPVADIASCPVSSRGATTDGLVIAVGSVDPDGKISSFSNRAGQTQSHFLLAPGNISADQRTGIPHASDPNIALTGTSFSTPLVSGALALLLDAFPMLTPQNAVSLLLNTADDYIDTEIDPIAGVAASVGPDPVGGRGVVNLERAFQPQGIMTLSLSGASVPVSRTFSGADAVFGDWAALAFDGLIAQDSYRRGFAISSAGLAWLPHGRFAGVAPARVNTRSGSLVLGNVGQVSWHGAVEPITPFQRLIFTPRDTIAGSVKFGDGHLSFGHNARLDTGLRTHTSLLTDSSTPADTWIQIEQTTPLGAAFASTHASDDRQSVQFGLSRSGQTWRLRASTRMGQDNTSALGGRVLSRIGREDGASFSLLSVDGSADAGPLTLSATLTAGVADIVGGLTGDVSVSAFAASVGADLASGRLSLTVSQPLRAESGWLDVLVPVAVSGNGSLIHQARRASLTPSGREIDLEAHWSVLFPDQRTGISIQAALATSPYHVAGSQNVHAVRATLWRTW